MRARLIKIYNHFGYDKQKGKFREEVLEFAAAAQGWMNHGTDDRLQSLINECADFEIINGQFVETGEAERLRKETPELYYTIIQAYQVQLNLVAADHYEQVKKIMDGKIDRTLLRIASGYYDAK